MVSGVRSVASVLVRVYATSCRYSPSSQTCQTNCLYLNPSTWYSSDAMNGVKGTVRRFNEMIDLPGVLCSAFSMMMS